MAVAMIIFFTMCHHISMMNLNNKKCQSRSSKEKVVDKIFYLFRLIKVILVIRVNLKWIGAPFGILYERVINVVG